jgi:hypothetical protein
MRIYFTRLFLTQQVQFLSSLLDFYVYLYYHFCFISNCKCSCERFSFSMKLYSKWFSSRGREQFIHALNWCKMIVFISSANEHLKVIQPRKHFSSMKDSLVSFLHLSIRIKKIHFKYKSDNYSNYREKKTKTKQILKCLCYSYQN